jgi:hypothetical protein
MTRLVLTACWAAATPGYLWATADLTLPAVTTTVTRAASCANTPVPISRTAIRTLRGWPGAGRSRAWTAPLSRSADAASPGRRWPSWAQASSTARTSSPFSRRNARG